LSMEAATQNTQQPQQQDSKWYVLRVVSGKERKVKEYLDKEISEKVKVTRPVTKTVDGVEQTIEETVEETRKHTEPGYLEAVYHLFSMAKKHGPLVLRMRTLLVPGER